METCSVIRAERESRRISTPYLRVRLFVYLAPQSVQAIEDARISERVSSYSRRREVSPSARKNTRRRAESERSLARVIEGATRSKCATCAPSRHALKQFFLVSILHKSGTRRRKLDEREKRRGNNRGKERKKEGEEDESPDIAARGEKGTCESLHAERKKKGEYVEAKDDIVFAFSPYIRGKVRFFRLAALRERDGGGASVRVHTLHSPAEFVVAVLAVRAFRRVLSSGTD